MADWYKILLVMVVIGIAFKAGHLFGIQDCPAYVTHLAALDSEAAADVTAMMVKPSARDMTCDRIFDLVGGDAAQSERAAQEDMVRE